MGTRDINNRLNRIEEIKTILREAEQQCLKISKDKLVAGLCCDKGIARRTMLEYVKLIVLAGYAEEYKEDNETIIKWIR